MRTVAWWVLVAAGLGGTQSFVACSAASEPKPEPEHAAGPLELGESCGSDRDCPGGFCSEHGCSKACESSDDCDDGDAPYVCGVDSNGQQSCVPQCPSALQSFVCVEGVSTSCQVASQEYCFECGCPGDLRCEPNVGCQEKRMVGEPCRIDDDCQTTHCGTTGICRVPAGASCDSETCDLCLVADGWSFCSRSCKSHLDCGGGYCVGSGDRFTCQPSCTPGTPDAGSCPGKTCDFVPDLTDNGAGYVCICFSSGTCTLQE
jgi:hypothetical protein